MKNIERGFGLQGKEEKRKQTKILQKQQYREKLEKRGIIEKTEKLSPHEKIPEALCQFLYKDFRHKIRIAGRKELKRNAGIYNGKKKEILLSDELFEGKWKKYFDDTLFHELGHFIDSELTRQELKKTKIYVPMLTFYTKEGFSQLDHEAVAEMFYYLALGAGDAVAAEKCTREDFKTKKFAWIDTYNLDYSKYKYTDWKKCLSRAQEAYHSDIGKKICEIMGWVIEKNEQKNE